MEPRWLDERQQQAWRSFLMATTGLFAQIDRQLTHDAGMPHGYYEVLVRLSEAPERQLRMSELADNSQSSRSRLSHAVAKLEKLGWVERRDCPTDRRGQVAVLTDAGFAALAEAAPRHVETVRRYLIDRLTPAQLEQLRGISDSVLDALRADGLLPEPGSPGELSAR